MATLCENCDGEYDPWTGTYDQSACESCPNHDEDEPCCITHCTSCDEGDC